MSATMGSDDNKKPRDAMSSVTSAKRSAGAMGPSGRSSKNDSPVSVVARAVDQRLERTGAPGRSQAMRATMPERERSFSQPGHSASPQNAQTTAAGTSTESSIRSSELRANGSRGVG